MDADPSLIPALLQAVEPLFMLVSPAFGAELLVFALLLAGSAFVSGSEVALYSLDEADLHNYDSRHLIWNHPTIGKEEMQELLHKLKTTYNSSYKLYKEGLGRLIFDELKRGKFWFFKNYILKSIIRSNFINDKEQVYFPNSENHKMVLTA